MDSILLIIIGIMFILLGFALLYIAFLSERYKEMKCDYIACHESLNKKK
jgi:hypothetical protein